MQEHIFSLPPQPWMQTPQVMRVMKALMAEDTEARFIGGCVRDAILYRPVGDIDIATPLVPNEIIRLLEGASIKVIPTGIEHGTVTAVVDHMPFEITTLRHDVAPDGRWSQVAFITDWKADAARRDFTMNALSCTLDGQVYDPFNGLADAQAGHVRFIGDPHARLTEDTLRLLRFFRFFAHYGRGKMNAAGLEACRQMAPQLISLSGERIRIEIIKLLKARNPVLTWETMVDQGIMDHLIPDGVHTDILKRLVLIENRLGFRHPLRRLASLLPVDLTKESPILQKINERLRLSSEEKDRLRAMMGTLPSIASIIKEGLRPLQRTLRSLGKSVTVDALLLQSARQGLSPEETGRLYTSVLAVEIPLFPIQGRDIVERGISSGPAVGQWLQGMESWWDQQDNLPDRETCLKELDRRLGKVKV